MWLQDVVSTLIVGFYFQQANDQGPQLSLDEKYIIFENLESLRGTNLLNFEEGSFYRQLDFIHQQSNLMLKANETSARKDAHVNLYEIGSCQVELLIGQCVSIMNYSKCVFKFFKQAQSMFFPMTAETSKGEKKQSEMTGGTGMMGNLINRSMSGLGGRNMKNLTYDAANNSRNDRENIDGSFYMQ